MSAILLYPPRRIHLQIFHRDVERPRHPYLHDAGALHLWGVLASAPCSSRWLLWCRDIWARLQHSISNSFILNTGKSQLSELISPHIVDPGQFFGNGQGHRRSVDNHVKSSSHRASLSSANSWCFRAFTPGDRNTGCVSCFCMKRAQYLRRVGGEAGQRPRA